MLKQELQQIIGHNLYRVRSEKGLTREQVAENAGVSATFYANLECGNKMMSIVTLRKLADALSVSADSLIYENRPSETIDRIQLILRSQPEQVAAFSEKLIRLCVSSIPQKIEEKNADGCKV